MRGGVVLRNKVHIVAKGELRNRVVVKYGSCTIVGLRIGGGGGGMIRCMNRCVWNRGGGHANTEW